MTTDPTSKKKSDQVDYESSEVRTVRRKESFGLAPPPSSSTRAQQLSSEDVTRNKDGNITNDDKVSKFGREKQEKRKERRRNNKSPPPSANTQSSEVTHSDDSNTNDAKCNKTRRRRKAKEKREGRRNDQSNNSTTGDGNRSAINDSSFFSSSEDEDEKHEDETPGAYLVGGANSDSDEFERKPSIIVGNSEINKHQHDVVSPLHADIVKEVDVEAELQRRMEARTVEGKAVLWVSSRNNSVDNDDAHNGSQRKTFIKGLITLWILIILAILIIVFVGRNSKQSKADGDKPIVESPPTVFSSGQQSHFDLAYDLFEPISGAETLSDVSTPQYQALSWLVNDDPLRLSMTTEDLSTQLLERYVITVLFFSTGGPNWVSDFNFLSNSSICDWQEFDSDMGVGRCNDDGSVTSINLIGLDAENNNLNGTLPSELAHLRNLESLQVSKSNLRGTLPPSLGNLTSLKGFSLSLNQLSGLLPKSYGNLRNLEWFIATENGLTGSIPSSFFRLPSLERLQIAKNRFTGTIPGTPIASEEIFVMDLGFNMLTGSIPDSVYSPTLNYLFLSYNFLSGTLSNEIGQLKKIESLNLDNNNLNGTLPTEMGNLSDLGYARMNENFFSGTIPNEVATLPRLIDLWLYDNSLSGSLPTSFSTYSGTSLLLHSNNMTGSLDLLCDRKEEEELVIFVEADCGGVNPQVNCSCCTKCCETSNEGALPSQGNCQFKHEKICELDSLYLENRNGPDNPSGTVCNCTGTGKDVALSCTDTQCLSCNRNGTLCAANLDHSYTYFEDSFIWDYFATTFQYVVGREDIITIESSEGKYNLTVNGIMCNSIGLVPCIDNYIGYKVDCENVEGAGSIDACNPDPEYDGPLTIIALADPALLEGCPPELLVYAS